MKPEVCSECTKAGAMLVCGLCESKLCKRCARFPEAEWFSFLAQVPPALGHDAYCEPCLYGQVIPELERYESSLEQAKDVQVFYKDQSKETRLFKRSEKPFQVKDCVDRDETILRLAFFAVESGFNGLIDVDLRARKVKSGSYQTSLWDGSGVPVHIAPVTHAREQSHSLFSTNNLNHGILSAVFADGLIKNRP